jgi:hypothetical protein
VNALRRYSDEKQMNERKIEVICQHEPPQLGVEASNKMRGNARRAFTMNGEGAESMRNVEYYVPVIQGTLRRS